MSGQVGCGGLAWGSSGGQEGGRILGGHPRVELGMGEGWACNESAVENDALSRTGDPAPSPHPHILLSPFAHLSPPCSVLCCWV